MAKTKAKNSAQDIADRWATGTQHFQEFAATTHKEVSEEARRMRDAGKAPGEIVQMAVTRMRTLADEYHEYEKDEA